jgi:hypothetical protein
MSLSSGAGTILISKEDVAMDPIHVLTQRLTHHFAECLHATGSGDFVPPTLEEWLEFWDDDDTDIGNLRNLEHWLSMSRKRAPGQRTQEL